jgi:hypothetical protein
VLPTVGRVVHYRAKTRGYTLPAIVTATADSLDPKGVELGHVPALSSATHVHLHVMTPGAQVQYQEFDVTQGDGPGTWNWPPRAPQPVQTSVDGL